MHIPLIYVHIHAIRTILYLAIFLSAIPTKPRIMYSPRIGWPPMCLETSVESLETNLNSSTGDSETPGHCSACKRT